MAAGAGERRADTPVGETDGENHSFLLALQVARAHALQN